MQPITIVSLTPAGASLGERLRLLLSEAEHLHRPQPFTTIVQARYRAGHRLVMITATGIAVRILAPLLRSKYTDPAVLVLDEQGRYVIPLLNGHEGGANAWAQRVAEYLGAQCVITSKEPYTHPLLVAGIGCKRGCPAEQIQALMETTLAKYGLDSTALHAIASVDLKCEEASLQTLAGQLKLPLVFYPVTILREYGERLSQRSHAVFRAVGCYGVAEAAALAHAEHLAGHCAQLLIPKHKTKDATFALARAYWSS